MSDTLSLSSVLDALHAQQQQVPAGERGLEKELEELRQRLQTDPSLENDPQFCTRLAWLVQDWPAHSGAGQLPALSPLLQAGLQQFATTVPGLENPTLRALMTQTATLADRGLVNDIREVSLQAAALPPAMQAGLMVQAAAEQLTTDAGMPPTPTVEVPARLQPVQGTPETGPITQDNPAADPVNAHADQTTNPTVETAEQSSYPAADRAKKEAQAQTITPSATSDFWGLSALGQAKMAERDAQRVAQIAANAQEQAAVVTRSIETLRRVGAPLFQEIDAAARSNNISVESVIAGIGPGGQFEDIGQQFQELMAQNPEFKAAHENLHASGRKLNARVSQLHGEAEVRGKKDTPEVANAEKRAAQVGLQLGQIPGQVLGQSLLREIGAMVVRLVEKFRDFFRGQQQDRTRDAGPAPSR